MSDRSLIAKVEVVMGGPGEEVERALQQLKRGVVKWSNAQSVIVGAPQFATQELPACIAPDKATAEELFDG